MRVALVVMAVWFGAWTTSALAEPAPQPTTPAPAPAANAAVESIPLTLAEAIILGIENNTNVELIRYEPPIADLRDTAAWGAYDPRLFGDYRYTSTNLPVASTFLPEQYVERNSTGSAGVTGLVPRLDWQYTVAYHGDDTSTNSLVNSFGTTYTSDLTLNLRAPLLRGAWWGYSWTQVEVMGIESELALEQFREDLMNIIAGPPELPLQVKVEQSLGIENAYWTLAARKQELEVANKSLDTSRKLLNQEKAEYDVGVKSRVDVIQAEAGVADREFKQITAENRYHNAQDDLVDRVYGPRLTPTSQIEIEPTDHPESYATFALDAETSTQRAMLHRPELTKAHQRVDEREILLKYAKNERLPQIDAIGSYGTHGLAGNDPNCSFGALLAGTCPTPNPPQQPGGIGTHYSDNTDFWFDGNKNRVWSAGALFSIPIPNTTARSNVSIAELELRRATTFVKRVEQDIVKQVRDAVRDLESALQGVEAAERNEAASNEQLRAENIKLEHGESTPFEVLLKEEALVQAQSQRIAALRVYHGSVTALDRAQGTLLEDRSIVLDRALPLR